MQPTPEQGYVRFDPLEPTIEKRVADLLRQMTLDEKVGQLVQENPFGPIDWGWVIQQRARAEQNGEAFDFHPTLRPEFEDALRAGKVSLINSADPGMINHLQHIAVQESRLHIPLLVGHDVIHGLRTIFPIPLAQSCSWNPALIEQVERTAAEEASACGVNWIYAPMVDIARDPRWGRIAEGAGEDPFLGRAIARARVRGFQSAGLASGRRVASCPKHYAAYGAAEAGREYNTVDISERSLREVYLPPFQAAFETGAVTTMSAFNEIGGVPASGNPFTLKTILRDEWQWPGVVVSDYNSIGELVQHGVAADLKEAARLGILSGVDMDMESGAYANHLAELVEEGSLPLAVLDEAVRRVLRLKFKLGLFENPFIPEDLAGGLILREDFRALALESARQSIVLLKNTGDLLPLAPGRGKVALIGPLGDNRADLLGAWSHTGQAADVETLRQGLSAYLDAQDLEVVKGCPIEGADGLDLPAALAAARKADVIVLALGENAGMSGEAHSRAHLGLPGRQQELADALAGLGKPLVVVLLCGRPLVIPRLAEQAGALLLAWHGGIRAGQAVADVLFGAANPSGKLTASWPRSEGQIPVYYAHKNTGRPAESKGTTQFDVPFRSTYLDELNPPAYAFGYGLSYTRFAYRDLSVETPTLAQDGTLAASVRIRNSGPRAGVEIAQLYVRDLVASITRPVRELKGFARVELQPGEERLVRFELPVQELAFWGPEKRWIVEPGLFKLWIGPSSDTGLEAQFEVK